MTRKHSLAWVKNVAVLGPLVLIWLASLYLYAVNPITNSLVSLILWLLCLDGIFIFAFLELPLGRIGTWYKLVLNNHYWLLPIGATAAVLRFWRLTTVPILLHDEARDAGLFAQMIMSGALKDYFGFFYGINNIFFVFASIPHYLFADPVMKVRFFSALFGVLTVILVYSLTSLLYGRKTAIVAGTLLAFYHVHLFFSRSEFLILFDGFYATLLLLFYYAHLKKKSTLTLVALATALGVGLHFYSGLRAIILIIFLTTLWQGFTLPGALKKLEAWTLTGLFFLVGIGPTITLLFNRREEFKASGNAVFIFTNSQPLTENVRLALLGYGNSLLVYVKAPLQFHYQYGGPLLFLPFSLFFIMGVMYACIRFRKDFNLLFVFLILGIPFFNSAFFTSPNAAHRLMSVVPVMIILTAEGISLVGRLIRRVLGRHASAAFLIVIVGFFAFLNLHLFFGRQVWQQAINVNEERAWEAQKIILQENKAGVTVYFLGNAYDPSYKSVPALEYLTQGYRIEDVTNAQELADKLATNQGLSTQNILFIVMPESLVTVPTQVLMSQPNHTATSEEVFYNDLRLFTVIRATPL